MRRLTLAMLMLATPALAAEPATIILPTPVVSAIAQYLSRQPFADVAQLMGQISACVSLQMPNQGARGECQAVTEAMAPKPPAAP